MSFVSNFPSRLGTVKDGARVLGVGEKTVRRMIDGGKLPGVCRLGHLVRLDLDALHKWVPQGCPAIREVEGGVVNG